MQIRLQPDGVERISHPISMAGGHGGPCLVNEMWGRNVGTEDDEFYGGNQCGDGGRRLLSSTAIKLSVHQVISPEVGGRSPCSDAA